MKSSNFPAPLGENGLEIGSPGPKNRIGLEKKNQEFWSRNLEAKTSSGDRAWLPGSSVSWISQGSLLQTFWQDSNSPHCRVGGDSCLKQLTRQWLNVAKEKGGNLSFRPRQFQTDEETVPKRTTQPMTITSPLPSPPLCPLHIH